MKTITLIIASFFYLQLANAFTDQLPGDPQPKNSGHADTMGSIVRPKVFFITPKDGDTVSGDVLVKFGVEGMKVEKAGVMKPLTGHHHLILDGTEIPKGQVIVKDETHLHFGDAQTETVLKLPKLSKGKHTLTLQFADGAHMSYGPSMSATIHITVK